MHSVVGTQHTGPLAKALGLSSAPACLFTEGYRAPRLSRAAYSLPSAPTLSRHPAEAAYQAAMCLRSETSDCIECPSNVSR